MEKDQMPTQVYSIKDLEDISGIKAHTIRIWEKRYGILKPARTNTNIRYYTDSDLKKLLNLSILIENGYKISQLSWFSPQEIIDNVIKVCKTKNDTHFVESLVVNMVDFNKAGFEQILNEIEQKFGFEKMVLEVVYPFFNKVGVLWQTGVINPAQEHFVSNIIKQKFFAAINELPEPNKNGKSFILFLSENEHHELGLLFSYFLLRKNGHKGVYLGQSVPLNDLYKAFNVIKPDYLISSFTTHIESSKLNDYLKNLAEKFSDNEILISGSLLNDFNNLSAQNLIYLKSPKKLYDYI